MLIKVVSCPINPGDKSFLKESLPAFSVWGNFGSIGVGCEGAGEVIEVGSNVDDHFIGK